MEWQASGLTPPRGQGLGSYSIPPTFPQEIPQKTHTFPLLVNMNIAVCISPYLYVPCVGSSNLVFVPNIGAFYLFWLQLETTLRTETEPTEMDPLTASETIAISAKWLVVCNIWSGVGHHTHSISCAT